MPLHLLIEDIAMTAPMHGRRFGALAFFLVSLLALAPGALAQGRDYQPGQKIEYRSSGYPEVWEEATFVRATPDGNQPIILQKPTQYQPAGFQRAVGWAEIRAIAAQPVPEPAPQPAPMPVPAPVPIVVAPPPAPPVDDGDRNRVGAPVPPAPPRGRIDPPAPFVPGAGLMSQADVLAYLRANIGPDPWQDPRRNQVKLDLAELIKARGLDFRYADSDREFQAQISRYGATSEITFPLRDNYGPPTKQPWLMGTWALGKIGAAVDVVRDDGLWRQGEIGVGNTGSLRLAADGTFAWTAVGAPSTAGRWRAASAAEMRSQGGDGIVLLDAKTGYDWIVTQDRDNKLAGAWIDIVELGSRQIDEYGSRR